MKVAFDTVVLGACCHPDAQYPSAVARVPERLAYLLKTLEEARATIIVPTPALAEFLVLAGNEAPRYLKELTGSSVFDVVPFDQRAAVEAAEAEIRAGESGDRKAGAEGPWQKIKVDRQIVAIAKVNEVDYLYSEDADVVKLGAQMGVKVKGMSGLPLPPEDPQRSMFAPDAD